MEIKKDKNNVAIMAGFLLILVVGIITYMKPPAKKGPSEENKISASENKAPETQKITSEELLQKIQNREKISIIDLRSKEEYQKEHLLDSKNIPFEEFAQKAPELDKNATYIFLDAGESPGTANLAADYLSKENFKNPLYLQGGFLDWKNKYNPTVSAGDPDSFLDQSKVKYIDSDKLKETMGSNAKNLFIVDLRDNGQFNGGHLKEALNIPLDSLEERRKEITAGKTIVLYGNNGQEAFQGAVRLFDMGFFSSLALSDGLDAWKQKKFEIVK